MRPHGRTLWIGIAALGMALLGCSSEPARPDAGPDADAASDGDEGQPEGDPTPDNDDTADADLGPVVFAVTAVLPSRGPVEGKTWVNVLGSGFVRGIAESPFDVRDVTDVTFGDNSAIDIEVVRDDMISVRTPAGVPGTAAVTVENPNGRFTLPGAFQYYETVTAARVVPADFSASGGTVFSVEGTGFTPDSAVLVGARIASAVVVESSESVRATAPPGAPGPVDVLVINRNGSALLFRAAVYHAQPTLFRIFPGAGDSTGGTPITAIGAGFEAGLRLLFGGQEATGVALAATSQLDAVTPAGNGTVDVTVAGPADTSTLPDGFLYLPEPSGSLALSGVAPAAGPSSGGNLVTIAGEGFSAGVTHLTFATAAASDVQMISDRLLSAIVPPAAAGRVDVTVGTSSGEISLPAAYRYFEPLRVLRIEPASGPATGGTPFSIFGSFFPPDAAVTFGGIEASSLVVASDTELTGVAPANTPGAVDVVVQSGDSSDRLSGGFAYTSGLSLLRLEPDFGAIAGGTYLTGYGDGFTEDLRISFGGQEGSVVQVLSPSVFTARTPRGDPGEVTVVLRQGQDTFELPAGFSYIDPTNDRGGASGGTIRGWLNVTVLDGSWTRYGAPLPGATVLLSDPAISGITDDRGQVTFSGPSIVRAVTITLGKENYQAVTVVNLNAANLTIYLFPNEREPIDIQPGGEVELSAISGRVFGFKDIPGLPTGDTVSLQARVNFTSWSIYGVPPYGGIPQGLIVEQDGGAFNFESMRFGNYSIYVWYGAYDSANDSFTPALLGLRRGIHVASKEPVTDQDVILGTYLDQEVAVTLLDPPLAPDGAAVSYGAYVSLDLGSDGVIYLSQATGTGTDLTLQHLPAAASNSFLFAGLAKMANGNPYPLSYTFRRKEGDLGEGVTLGPFLGFTRILQPPANGTLTNGRIAWEVQDPKPELLQIFIETAELMPVTLWQVILPGDATEVTLPVELLGTLPQGEPLVLRMFTADSPRFTFDRFNYSQLNTGRWTSYTLNVVVFTAP